MAPPAFMGAPLLELTGTELGKGLTPVSQWRGKGSLKALSPANLPGILTAVSHALQGGTRVSGGAVLCPEPRGRAVAEAERAPGLWLRASTPPQVCRYKPKESCLQGSPRLGSHVANPSTAIWEESLTVTIKDNINNLSCLHIQLVAISKMF